MNERIKELAERALFESDFDDEQNIKITMDIFAELIVRECADLTRWQEYDMSVEQRIRLGIYQDIKQHFGVE